MKRAPELFTAALAAITLSALILATQPRQAQASGPDELPPCLPFTNPNTGELQNRCSFILAKTDGRTVTDGQGNQVDAVYDISVLTNIKTGDLEGIDCAGCVKPGNPYPTTVATEQSTDVAFSLADLKNGAVIYHIKKFVYDTDVIRIKTPDLDPIHGGSTATLEYMQDATNQDTWQHFDMTIERSGSTWFAQDTQTQRPFKNLFLPKNTSWEGTVGIKSVQIDFGD